MSITAPCPVCQRPGNGLLCDGIYVNGRDVSCTGHLERDLGDVASIVGDLDITLSRQDCVPSVGGNSQPRPDAQDEPGLSAIASTRNPVHWGASIAAGTLENVLTTWVRDLTDDDWRPGLGVPPSAAAAGHMLMLVREIRRHPAVDELVDQITDAIAQARRAVDRPADRTFVGPCNTMTEGVKCIEDLYARRGASEVRCKVCSAEHDVAARREWLLDQAEDRLVTVREAARYLGEVGGQAVTEDRIRGHLRRGQRLAFRPGTNTFRLGDLLDILRDDSQRRAEKRSA